MRTGDAVVNALGRRLLGALPSVPIVCAVLAALAAASALAIIIQADALAEVLANAVTAQSPADALASGLLLFGGALAGRAVLTWVGQMVAQRTAATVKERLRRDALAHAQRLGPGWLAGRHSGGIATTLGRGLDALDPYFTGYFPQLFHAAIVPLAVLVYLFTTDVAAALVICVTLPLIPVFGVLVGLQTKRVTARQWRALERLGGRFLDLVAGLPTLRAFGRASAQARAVQASAEEHRAATMSTLRMAFLSALVLELVATLSVALVAVPVGLRLLGGNLDLHTALVVLLLAPEAYLPLRILGSQFHASTEGLEAARRVFAILDTPVIMNDPVLYNEWIVHDHGSGRGSMVWLDRVTVRYPNRSDPALDQATLAVAPGERVALVGPSGSGKSTLLAVVLGLVRPESGRVVVTGAHRQPLDPATEFDMWRPHVAWVPQRPHLFARSVADNIRLGAPEATQDEVEHAARLAAADSFIEQLPQGYETELGERGVGLSAGQRQRIALARAFLRDAPVLILDEPTAGLDASSEAAVIDATRRLMAGRTVLVVAHRPAMVADADRVVRLDSGRIADAPADGPGAAVVS